MWAADDTLEGGWKYVLLVNMAEGACHGGVPLALAFSFYSLAAICLLFFSSGL